MKAESAAGLRTDQPMAETETSAFIVSAFRFFTSTSHEHESRPFRFTFLANSGEPP
jgi:hypothetical protein